ncbi:sugar transferase [Leuconostoc gelidum subsp. gasicomitatum]|nr:sugar transferase [Leuconostoc gasicomitatum]MBZ5970014.1 sugar transferase [Leuconostoc gasicomitatum]MBZ5973532.1 sugar transferase [Leuconostoc gasicomitatum]MBZ5997633.1 sugar transferase [Leuconostoc gasicomitatum]
MGERNLFYRRVIKRILDLLLAVPALIILLLPLIVIGIIVKLTSKGPAFFIQERYGRNSKPFNLYKFRSMTDKAPVKANSEFDDITSYVTPFGMFIRKTSIDELPQLWNVVKGDMSFIGPRPLAKTDLFVIESRKISGADQVKPGITGWAQVNGRNNITDFEKSKFDAYYVREIYFGLDFKISILTFFHVFLRTGINSTEKKVGNDE